MKTFKSKAYKDRITGLDDSVVQLHSSKGPLGQTLICGSADGKVRSWNLADKSKLLKYQLQKKQGRAKIAAYLFQQATVTVGFSDGEIGIFNLEDASLKSIMKGHEGCINALQSYKEDILSGGQDCSIRRWSKQSFECQAIYQFSDPVSCLLVWENTLLIGSWDRILRILDLETNQIKKTLLVADQPIKCLTRQENTVYVGGCDCLIRSWDLDTLDCKVFQGHTSWVLQVRLHGNLLYSCSDDRTIKIWNLETTKCEEEFVGHQDGVTSIEFANGLLCSGSFDHSIRTWDLQEMYRRIEERGLLTREDVLAWKLETFNRVLNTKKKKKKGKSGKSKKGKKK